MPKFLDEVLNKIPEAQRAAVQETLAAVPEVAAALDTFVGGQKSEFSQQMDAIAAKHAEQLAWYTDTKELVDLGQKAKTAGFVPGSAPPAPAPAPAANVVSREDFEAAQRSFVTYQAVTQRLGFAHLREFNEVLNLETLLADPNVAKLGLEGAYNASVATRRQEAATAAQAAEVKRQVDEQVALRMKGGQNPSYPSAVPAGSPLDALAPVTPGGVDVSDLVDAYNTVKAGGSI